MLMTVIIIISYLMSIRVECLPNSLKPVKAMKYILDDQCLTHDQELVLKDHQIKFMINTDLTSLSINKHLLEVDDDLNATKTG
jgi:hypothetical protein